MDELWPAIRLAVKVLGIFLALIFLLVAAKREEEKDERSFLLWAIAILLLTQ